MRDHKNLRAFELADQIALQAYQLTRSFPKDELYALTSQTRRAAVSVASNIVEGCARTSEAEYVHFLDIAFGSLRELRYQFSLAVRLEYLPRPEYVAFEPQLLEAEKVLSGLIRSLRNRRMSPHEFSSTFGL